MNIDPVIAIYLVILIGALVTYILVRPSLKRKKK